MQITGLLAQVAVSDLAEAEEWYGRLFDGGPDARPMDGLVEWHLGDGRGVQLWRDPDRAGRSTFVLRTDDIDAFAAHLDEVGIAGPEVQQATASRILPIEDLEGNRIVVTGT